MDVFTAFGLSASAGLNAYIPLLIVSLVARFTNWIELGQPWDALESWWVIGLLVVLSLIEFFADSPSSQPYQRHHPDFHPTSRGSDRICGQRQFR